MIDISSYIQKLDWLKEYMGYAIDNKQFFVIVDIYAVPQLSVKQMFTIYEQTGVLFFSKHEEGHKQFSFNSFDEFVTIKQAV